MTEPGFNVIAWVAWLPPVSDRLVRSGRDRAAHDRESEKFFHGILTNEKRVSREDVNEVHVNTTEHPENILRI